MTKLNLLLLICAIVLFIIVLCVIIFITYNDKIKSLLKKIDETANNCDEKIINKYNIIIKIIDIIENKLKIESKTFSDVKKINIETHKSFKLEKTLNKCYEEILIIKEDNSKTKSLKTFKEAMNDYEENELHIISLRTYYNKNTMVYNSLLKKFPYNVVAKLKKYKLKLLFEGKEIEKED